MPTLTCRTCNYRTLLSHDQLVGRLRLLGLLKREKRPTRDLVLALAPNASQQIACPECGAEGLAFNPLEEADDEEGDWQAAQLCEICRQPIPPERLEALPATKRCVACQGQADAGTLPDDDPEFCQRCGGLIELRVSTGPGLTRYRRVCTSCGSKR